MERCSEILEDVGGGSLRLKDQLFPGKGGRNSPPVGVPAVAQRAKNPTAAARVAVEVQGGSPAQWAKGSGVATAVAWIQSLAQELPYAVSRAIKTKQTQKPPLLV